MNLHDFSFDGLKADETHRGEDFAGKAVLVVNTASECGFTPQYADLQALWRRYQESGLAVLGLPSNDFGGQEPGDAEAIQAFCTDHYAVDFPMSDKLGVLEQPHPFFQAIQTEYGDAGMPQWNFHKYLFAPDGELVEIWGSKTQPLDDDIVQAVEANLPV